MSLRCDRCGRHYQHKLSFARHIKLSDERGYCSDADCVPRAKRATYLQDLRRLGLVPGRTKAVIAQAMLSDCEGMT